MMLNEKTARTYQAAAIVMMLTMTSAFAAPVVQNSGFEADTYTNGPGGTAGQNSGTITDWTISDANQVGLNPFWTDSSRTAVAGSPHADNGAVPEGDQVAFVRQNASLSQTVSDFLAGRLYAVTYRENARSNPNTESLRVDLDATTIVADHTVNPVGGSNPYHFVTSDLFTATSSSHNISLISTSGLDASVLLDDVQVATVIHRDTFTLNDGTGTDNAALDDTAAEYSIVPGATWSADGPLFADDAGQQFVDRNSSGDNSGALPYNATANDRIMSLSAQINPGTSDNNAWTAIGFRQNAADNNISSAGVLWVLLRENGNYVLHADEAGGVNNVSTGIVAGFNAGAFNNVELIWDRRINVAHLLVNGQIVLSDFDLNATADDGLFDPTVGGVGFSMTSGEADGSANAARVDDFMLTSVLVPEPSALAMLSLGLITLARRRTR